MKLLFLFSGYFLKLLHIIMKPCTFKNSCIPVYILIFDDKIWMDNSCFVFVDYQPLQYLVTQPCILHNI